MINPKNGEYSPTPVYHRGLARGIIRAAVVKKHGYHNVNRTMASIFKRRNREE